MDTVLLSCCYTETVLKDLESSVIELKYLSSELLLPLLIYKQTNKKLPEVLVIWQYNFLKPKFWISDGFIYSSCFCDITGKSSSVVLLNNIAAHGLNNAFLPKTLLRKKLNTLLTVSSSDQRNYSCSDECCLWIPFYLKSTQQFFSFLFLLMWIVERKKVRKWNLITTVKSLGKLC